jgi:hypothetical protein
VNNKIEDQETYEKRLREEKIKQFSLGWVIDTARAARTCKICKGTILMGHKHLAHFDSAFPGTKRVNCCLDCVMVGLANIEYLIVELNTYNFQLEDKKKKKE